VDAISTASVRFRDGTGGGINGKGWVSVGKNGIFDFKNGGLFGLGFSRNWTADKWGLDGRVGKWKSLNVMLVVESWFQVFDSSFEVGHSGWGRSWEVIAGLRGGFWIRRHFSGRKCQLRWRSYRDKEDKSYMVCEDSIVLKGSGRFGL